MAEGERVRSTVCPFPKVEKKNSNKYKAPRMIQARHITFNIAYGKYIKPLESIVTKYFRLHHHFGKGSPNEIAAKMNRLSMKYKYKTEGDHKTFDAHVTVEMLKLVHTYVSACYPKATELPRLMKCQLKNRCVSRNGDKYTVKGTRMSGDVDTSFGNSLINLAILYELLKQLGLKGEMIVNGDDFVLYTNDPINVAEAKSILATMNMETDMQESQLIDEMVEFCCQKLVVSASGNRTLVRDPTKTFGKFGMTFVKVKRYSTYLLENLHGMWMMNKTNPMGVSFRMLYFECLKLESKTFGVNYKLLMRAHRKFDYKYLERSYVYNIREAARDAQDFSDEITVSQLLAYESLIDVVRWANKIRLKINQLYAFHPKMGSHHLERASIGRYIYINHILKLIEVIVVR